jgi:CheY-like chemotaxis protein
MNDQTGGSPLLLVEDNQSDIDLALYAFNKIRFSNPIEICRSGTDVMVKMDDWQNNPSLPLCVLLDIKMPGMSGLEVLAKMKERFPSIPVIILTSSRENSDIDQAYALGANSYIVKPVEMEKFIEIARQLNLYWMVLNSAPSGQ